MKVVIAGAGSVGRSIAMELLGNGHEVLLIESNPNEFRPARVPGAQWLEADAVESSALRQAGLESADVVVAATGDDKTNLVLLLIAKTEFAVPRTVGRVNSPSNEWLFDASWGVDVAVSTPRLMTALVEEAVEIGGVVRLLELQQGDSALFGFTVQEASPLLGRPVREVDLPAHAALVALVRDGRTRVPSPDDVLQGLDELLLLAGRGAEDEIARALHGH